MRHLLFHIWPRDSAAGLACIRWHLRHLEAAAHLFDGRRIFAVVTGEGLLKPDDVLKLLPTGAEIVIRPNDAAFGESCTFPMLLAKAFTLEPSDTVFYGHTKGISHLGTPQEAPSRWWALSMYRWLLSPEALAKLEAHPSVGWMKYCGPHGLFPKWCNWHYAGNFWWFRAAEIYRKAWWLVAPTPFGAEAYPSSVIPEEQAGACHSLSWVKLLRPDGYGYMYFPEFWNAFGIPAGAEGQSYE